MSTAKVRVAFGLIEELIFGYAKHPVTVHGVVEVDAEIGYLTFEISGDDVPDSEGIVRALCSVQTNRAKQRFVTMTFEPVLGVLSGQQTGSECA